MAARIPGIVYSEPIPCPMYPELRMQQEISALDLEKLRARPPVPGAAPLCLLDVRETWEAATASIAGSLLMPMGEISERARELDPNTHIVVYCHHGVRSMSAVIWLREQGFSQAQSLTGGIDAWSELVDRSIPRY